MSGFGRRCPIGGRAQNGGRSARRWLPRAWPIFALGAVLVAGAAEGASPPEWRELSGPELETAPTLENVAAVTIGDRVVLLGGTVKTGTWRTEAWEWRTGWGAIASPNPVYDGVPVAANGGILLFGGREVCSPLDGNPQVTLCQLVAGTWRFDGGSWTDLAPSSIPTWRPGTAMAALGEKVVLFGGGEGGSARNDTWVWDGVTWTELVLATVPSARSGHAMVPYDGKVLLFGGIGARGEALRDTWVWDGATWTELSPAASPSARWDHAMATLENRIILVGGRGNSPLVGTSLEEGLEDTWAWDGLTWTELTPSASPSARWAHTMATIGGKVVLFGGTGFTVHRNLDGILTEGAARLRDTWEWDGEAWTRIDPIRPAARMGAAMAALGDRIVLFGGAAKTPGVGARGYLGDTWAWNGAAWTELHPAMGPSPRYALAMAAADREVVAFGGWGEEGPTADTWTFTDEGWTRKEATLSPPARSNHAMAAWGDKVVLFGGYDGTGVLGDTWIWDGSSWTGLNLPVSPPARSNHAMATRGDRVVLFGGWSCGTQACAQIGDTWEFDGLAWKEIRQLRSSPCGQPSRRSDHAMATIGDRVVTFGGTTTDDMGYVGGADTWEWDGTTWSNSRWSAISGATSPLGRSLHAMTTLAGHPVVFGGASSFYYGGIHPYLADDTWALSADGSGKIADACVAVDESGCACVIADRGDAIRGGGWVFALLAALAFARTRRKSGTRARLNGVRRIGP